MLHKLQSQQLPLVISVAFYPFKFKTIAEKMRDLLPQPSISNNQTVKVEREQPIENEANDSNEGAGEAIASQLDDHENLV